MSILVMSPKQSPLSSIQYASLAALAIYTSGLSFLMHASRKGEQGAYLVSTSVFLAEMLKLCISVGMEYRLVKSGPSYVKMSNQEILENGLEPLLTDEKQQKSSSREEIDDASPFFSIFTRDCWKLSIPAILYVLQNMLQLFAITAISPATYQAVTQMKILAASLLSVVLLKRRYTRRQWASVCFLCLGVAILSTNKVQNGRLASGSSITSTYLSSEEKTLQPLKESSAKIAGILAVLLACSFGSGGAVVMEMVIKDAKASLWTRNAQLAAFSMIASGGAILYDLYCQGRFEPLQYFGLLAWSTVVARSLGGFLIAYVLQQCDAVLKGIATSLAMILSLIVEIYIMGEESSMSSILGAMFVVVSSFTYVHYQSKDKR